MEEQKQEPVPLYSAKAVFDYVDKGYGGSCQATSALLNAKKKIGECNNSSISKEDKLSGSCLAKPSSSMTVDTADTSNSAT